MHRRRHRQPRRTSSRGNQVSRHISRFTTRHLTTFRMVNRLTRNIFRQTTHLANTRRTSMRAKRLPIFLFGHLTRQLTNLSLFTRALGRYPTAQITNLLRRGTRQALRQLANTRRYYRLLNRASRHNTIRNTTPRKDARTVTNTHLRARSRPTTFLRYNSHTNLVNNLRVTLSQNTINIRYTMLRVGRSRSPHIAHDASSERIVPTVT